MPGDISDAELATAATACRAMAYQEGERAKKMENPMTRPPLESNARRYAALAEKLEAARKKRTARGAPPSMCDWTVVIENLLAIETIHQELLTPAGRGV
jgi:hypothetical protein